RSRLGRVTSPGRLGPGSITLSASRASLLLGKLNHLAAYARPTLRRFLMAITLRFLAGTIALKTSRLRLGFGQLRHAAAHTNPAARVLFAIPQRFFSRAVTLRARRFRFTYLDYLSIAANPAGPRPAVSQR